MISTYASNDRFDWGNQGEVTSTYGSWSNGSQLIAETANDRLAGISNTFQENVPETARWAKYGVANAAGVLANVVKCVPLLPKTMIILEEFGEAQGPSGSFYERYTRAVEAGFSLLARFKLKLAITSAALRHGTNFPTLRNA